MLLSNEIMLSLIILTLLFVYSESQSSINNGNVCKSDVCVEVAKYLKSSLNTSVDPCDDFYGFACGGWMQKYKLPEDKSFVSSATFADDRMEAILNLILVKNIIKEPYAKKVSLFYKECLNMEKINKRSSKPLKNLLSYFGSWPLISDRNSSLKQMDWLDILIQLRNLGMNTDMLFEVNVAKSTRDNSVNNIYIGQAKLALPSLHYYEKGLNDPMYNAYYVLMIKSAKLLGAKITKGLKSDLRDILAFETKLAAISKEDEKSFYRPDFEIRRFEIIRILYNLRFHEYFQRLYNININGEEKYIIYNTQYLQKLITLIEETDETVVANYLLWRTIYTSIPHLSDDWLKIFAKFKKEFHGRKKIPARYVKCLNFVNKWMKVAVSTLFTQRSESSATIAMVSNIVNNIQDELIETIQESVWMQSETKWNLIKKVTNMIKFIAYPDEMRYPMFANYYYKELKLTNDYFENVFLVYKFKRKNEIKKLFETNQRNRWRTKISVGSVQAFHNYATNAIYIPQAMLQPPFFHKQWQNYLNFAGIGSVIGHEIIHGFDSLGKQFDMYGNLNQRWDEEADKIYRLKANCVIKQYSAYKLPGIGLNVNGVRTQVENIADIEGYKLAYKSYKKWEKINGNEQTLPLLKYTTDQLFWINAANQFCSKLSTEFTRFIVRSGRHSPQIFRVNGAFSNIDEFSQSFQCKKGSKMNPENKCAIW